MFLAREGFVKNLAIRHYSVNSVIDVSLIFRYAHESDDTLSYPSKAGMSERITAMSVQPIMRDVHGRRTFACFPAAALACLVDPYERMLLLAHPQRRGEWEIVNGALEAGETIVEGVLREIREEVGAAARVRPLGSVHVSS